MSETKEHWARIPIRNGQYFDVYLPANRTGAETLKYINRLIEICRLMGKWCGEDEREKRIERQMRVEGAHA